jgi:hypothetical protein
MSETAERPVLHHIIRAALPDSQIHTVIPQMLRQWLKEQKVQKLSMLPKCM